MKRWRGLALGTLTMLLLSAPIAETVEAAARPATVEERDAARAAKAEERAERQAQRAAAKEARRQAIADAKAARAAAKAAPPRSTTVTPEVSAPSAPPAPTAKPVLTDASPAAAPASEAASAAETSAAPTGTGTSTYAARQKEIADRQAARAAERADRQQARAEAKADRAAAKADRRAALAADKAERRADAAAARAEKKAAQRQHRREKNARYKTLFEDNGFTYYMDAQNTRWVPRPYSNKEFMIDAWVRLVENTTGAPVGEDGKIRPARYFLEHYYISEARREVMFLAELEVTGRPNNDVKERTYDPRRWEKLVPGSIEDALYEAITKEMRGAPKGPGSGGMSLRDMIEEYARISF